MKLNLKFLFLLFLSSLAAGNPTGGLVIDGNATFQQTDSVLSVLQSTERAIINWEEFSVQQGEITEFIQPGRNSATLNRVVTGAPTAIHGALRANGNVFVINPNGILVGSSGKIDVNGLVLSTLDISNENFMAGGDLTFKGNSQGGLTNLGVINTVGGDVFLLANTVDNSGQITAANGVIGLGAGTEILIQAQPNDLGQRLFVRAGGGGHQITNSGVITANVVEMAVHGNQYALGINNGGSIRANGVSRDGGRVFLNAGQGNIENSGTIAASISDGNGGRVQLKGGDVLNGGIIDASGSEMGGIIDIEANKINFTGSGSATADGKSGGEINLKAAHIDLASGSMISAQGRDKDGGIVNISGSDAKLGGTINVSAPENGGTVSIDGMSVETTENSEINATGENGGAVEILAKNPNRFSKEPATISLGGKIDISGKQNGGTVTTAGDSVTQSKSGAIVAAGVGGKILVSNNHPNFDPTKRPESPIKSDLPGFRDKLRIAVSPPPQSISFGGSAEADSITFDGDAVGFSHFSAETKNDFIATGQSINAEFSRVNSGNDIHLTAREELTLLSSGFGAINDIYAEAQQMLLTRLEKENISVGYGRSAEREVSPPTIFAAGGQILVNLSSPNDDSTFTNDASVLSGVNGVTIKADYINNLSRLLRREVWVKKRPRPWKSHRWYLVDHWTANSPAYITSRGKVSIDARADVKNSGTVRANEIEISANDNILNGLGDTQLTDPTYDRDLGVIELNSESFLVLPEFAQTASDLELLSRIEEIGFYRIALADNWKGEIPDPTILALRIVTESLFLTGKPYLSDEWDTPLEQLLGLMKNRADLDDENSILPNSDVGQSDLSEIKTPFISLFHKDKTLVEQLYIPKSTERLRTGGLIESETDIDLVAGEEIEINGELKSGTDINLTGNVVNISTRIAAVITLGNADDILGGKRKQLSAKEVQQTAAINAGRDLNSKSESFVVAGAKLDVARDSNINSGTVVITGLIDEKAITVDTGNIGRLLGLDPFQIIRTFKKAELAAGRNTSISASESFLLVGSDINTGEKLVIVTDMLGVFRPEFTTNVTSNYADLSFSGVERVKETVTDLYQPRLFAENGNIEIQSTNGELNFQSILAGSGETIIFSTAKSLNFDYGANVITQESRTIAVEPGNAVLVDFESRLVTPVLNEIYARSDILLTSGEDVNVNGLIANSGGDIKVTANDSINIHGAKGAFTSSTIGFGVSTGSGLADLIPGQNIQQQFEELKNARHPTEAIVEGQKLGVSIYNTANQLRDIIAPQAVEAPTSEGFNISFNWFNSDFSQTMNSPSQFSGNNIVMRSGEDINLRDGFSGIADGNIELVTNGDINISHGVEETNMSDNRGSMGVSLEYGKDGVIGVGVNGSYAWSEGYSEQFDIANLEADSISFVADNGTFTNTTIRAGTIDGQFSGDLTVQSVQSQSKHKSRNAGLSVVVYPAPMLKGAEFGMSSSKSRVTTAISSIIGEELSLHGDTLITRAAVVGSINSDPDLDFDQRVDIKNHDLVESKEAGFKYQTVGEGAFESPFEAGFYKSKGKRSVESVIGKVDASTDPRGEFQQSETGLSVASFVVNPEQIKADIDRWREVFTAPPEVEVPPQLPEQPIPQVVSDVAVASEDSVAVENPADVEVGSEDGGGEVFVPTPKPKPDFAEENGLNQPSAPPSQSIQLERQYGVNIPRIEPPVNQLPRPPTEYTFDVKSSGEFFQSNSHLLRQQGETDETIQQAAVAFEESWGQQNIQNWSREVKEIAFAGALLEGRIITNQSASDSIKGVLAGRQRVQAKVLYDLADHVHPDDWFARNQLKAKAVGIATVFIADSVSDFSLKGILKKPTKKGIDSLVKGGNKQSTQTVGRWMSPIELKEMKRMSKVQEGGGGITRVANPASPTAYKNAPKGDVYVEFDVPASRLKPHSKGTSKISGPGSPDARLSGKKAEDFLMPEATNIKEFK